MDNEVKIKILDYVHCEIKKGKELLDSCLSCNATYYKKGQYRKIKKNYRKKFISKNSIFLTGLLNKVKKFCIDGDINIIVEDEFDVLKPIKIEKESAIQNINFKSGAWSFQNDLIKLATENQRGIVKAATASGKTTIMMGIISCYPSFRTLFLSNTHIPISQFKDALKKNNFNFDRIDCFTVQSFYRKDPSEYCTKYDIILIDECHEGFSSINGMYGKILTNSLASIRLGFTATMPESQETNLILEGLLGPVIGEFTIQDGMERGVLAKPKIKLIELPFNQGTNDLRKYKDIYSHGVVNNRAMNRLIVKTVDDFISKNKTALVLVLEIQHGKNIIDIAEKIYGLDLVFVEGKTDSETREKIRLMMQSKKIKGVIATAVFRKALNIPSLDCVINACGGKSEVTTLQAIGRGLRKTSEKDYVDIIDFFNPSHHYLIKHFGYRMCMYFREGWI